MFEAIHWPDDMKPSRSPIHFPNELEIAASPETVYRVWTTRTGEWWAPRPYTTPGVELDLRPGGIGRMDMRSPDGTDMPNAGVFLEVVPNRRLVFTGVLGPDFRPTVVTDGAPLFTGLVLLEPQADGRSTHYVARAMHADTAGQQAHAAMGFDQGWNAALDQLVALMSGAKTS